MPKGGHRQSIFCLRLWLQSARFSRYNLPGSSSIICPAMAYRKRVVDAELRRHLAALGAVLIEGPKTCGKTETARQLAASEVRLDIDADARQAAAVDPTLVLEGATPRLIDEWQVRPAVWNHVRHAVDDRSVPGQFILTGSAVPPDDETRHTGAGRITRMPMRPMSLLETGHSDGTVSLADLLAGGAVRAAERDIDVRDLARLIAVGGWPAIQHLDLEDAL
ncbi:MAG: ATP-binding protein, partial [Thermoleophilaceae bacterium]